jgi:hypothetical protein
VQDYEDIDAGFGQSRGSECRLGQPHFRTATFLDSTFFRAPHETDTLRHINAELTSGATTPGNDFCPERATCAGCMVVRWN